MQLSEDISIHAPARGGDGTYYSAQTYQKDFNPRPREGGDTKTGQSGSAGVISIHAPARGGDVCRWVIAGADRHFNPRPREGGRRYSPHAWPRHKTFQSTPPRGGATTVALAKAGVSANFNPRPREGGRRFPVAVVSWATIFQSTPPRGGATAGLVHIGGAVVISIHAPARGGDTSCRHLPAGGQISIHAPARGGDSKDAQFYLRIFDKQVELLRFLGKIRGGCLRNPEKDRRFLGKSLANLPAISGHLDFAGGGKACPGYPCAVPLPRRAACVRGSGDPPADRCSSYRNAPLFSHIASPDSKSADCLSQDP